MEVLQRVWQSNRVRLALLVAIVGIGLVAVVMIVHPDRPVIPAAIRSQVVSTVFVPGGRLYSVDSSSAKYDGTNKLLTFKISNHGASVATIAEQPSPEQFVDIPESSSKFFQQAGEYKVFESNYGTVHLLHPGKGINDAAAMNAKGTLMFVNPSVTFSEDDWRKLFQSLIVVQ